MRLRRPPIRPEDILHAVWTHSSPCIETDGLHNANPGINVNSTESERRR